MFPNYPGAEHPIPRGRRKLQSRRLRDRGSARRQRDHARGLLRARLFRHERRRRRQPGRGDRRAPGDARLRLPVHRRSARRSTNACDVTTRHPGPDWLAPDPTTARCSWDPTDPASVADQPRAERVQAFYLVNRFHDHLATAADRLHDARTSSPAARAATTPSSQRRRRRRRPARRRPDDDHINNANMSTPPDGGRPRCRCTCSSDDPASLPFRNINGGDSPAIVWHEYTHGLSNRLVTYADGSGALSSRHAGAMGEAWSDWYALDLLHRDGLETDDRDARRGRHRHLHRRRFALARFEPIDCPRRRRRRRAARAASTPAPAASLSVTSGKRLRRPEVHADGEIWAQTLWDLRTADRRPAARRRARQAEELVTEGMRLSPPEPSFLDMRNAILAADVGDRRRDRDLIWDVFAGAAWASSPASLDAQRHRAGRGLQPPAGPGAPTGTSPAPSPRADTGLPLAGVQRRLRRSHDGPGVPRLPAPATSARTARYTLTSGRPARYGELVFERRAATTASSATSSVTRGRDARAERRAAARLGVAQRRRRRRRTSTTTPARPFGCGARELIDQTQGVGWSPFNPASRRPGQPRRRAADARSSAAGGDRHQRFGMDPSNTCGDGPTATTKDYRSRPRPTARRSRSPSTGSVHAGRRATGSTSSRRRERHGVRFVRLTLLSPQDDGAGDSGADSSTSPSSRSSAARATCCRAAR